MEETPKIIPGEYSHPEGLTYRVLGLANLIDNHEGLTEVGIALGVAGYEETGQVSGEKIAVYSKIDVEKDSQVKMVYIKIDNFDAPNQVVVYKQLGKGKLYPAGQLWFRPIDNFLQHFTLIEK